MYANNRLDSISEYHFQRLDIIKKKLIDQGKVITDLSIGDPDMSVHRSIVNSLIENLYTENFNKYPPYEGIEQLKRSIIKYYNEVFSVKLTMDEVIVLIGSKEGINNIIPAVCNLDDIVLVPKPSYPVYETCCKLWGVKTINIKLHEDNCYLPKISDIEISTNKKCRMLVLNYPNNPTGAVANKEFYSEIIEFCKAHEIVVYNDGAYNEIIDSGQNPLSILQCDKGKYSIEFGTFSKTYNMTGFRIGYAVGNARIINALLKIKSNVDSGQFIPIQQAAVAAMNLGRSYVNHIKETYFDRKKCVENLLSERDVKFFVGHGTFYIWGSVPKGYTSARFCEELLDNYGVVVTPGTAFDSNDSIHFRISLTKCKEELIDSISRLKKY